VGNKGSSHLYKRGGGGEAERHAKMTTFKELGKEEQLRQLEP
jgi:hypothetical protein